MESLGNKLRTAREEKGYSLDYVSRETNISGRYLEALEQEEYSVFPGEPYLLGFLKNYGAYLELNVNELLSLYRSFKIQEEPVPVEALLKSPSRAPKILLTLAVIIVILGILGGGFMFFYKNFRRPPVEVPQLRPPQEYTMNTESLERRFYRGDTILIPLKGNNYRIELSGLGDTVTLTTPIGPVRLDLSQEASVDLDSDGYSELTVSVADFAKNDSDAGALIRFELDLPKAPETASAGEPLQPGAQGNVVIFTSPNAYPFTLQVSFQGYCLFRWEILYEQARQGRNEQYFQNTDELNIQAQNGIRIGLSNAQAVRLQVIGGGRTVPLEAGGPGEVVVADVRWVRDEENRYRLVMARLE